MSDIRDAPSGSDITQGGYTWRQDPSSGLWFRFDGTSWQWSSPPATSDTFNGQMGAPPVPSSPDTFTGQMGPPPVPTPDPTPTPTPAAPAYPALDMSWRNNDQYGFYGRAQGQQAQSYYPNLDTSQQLFYQTDAGQHPAYQRFMAGEADPTSYYSRWLGGQEGRVEGGFENVSVADPNLQRTYYYDQAAQGLDTMYRNLPGWQQGQNAGISFPGRRG